MEGFAMRVAAAIRTHVIVIGAISLLLAGFFVLPKVRASGDVDMVLLLALDISASVDDDEYLLMRNGLAAALASPEVAKAVSSGVNGAIGLSVVQWSGFSEQHVNIAWTRIETEADLKRISSDIRHIGRRWDHGSTDIGGAIDFCRRKVLEAPFAAPRRVIDIAGDGTNNTNRTPNLDRDAAVKAGIIINGLAITGGRTTLIDYYNRFVIGGEGSFVETADDYPGFERAMRRKLIREIGGQFLF